MDEWLEAESEVLEQDAQCAKTSKSGEKTAPQRARDHSRAAIPCGKEEDTVITSKRTQLSCVMKLSHFLRYYRNKYGIALPPEEADEEAAKLGLTIDRTGETTTKKKPAGERRCGAAQYFHG